VNGDGSARRGDGSQIPREAHGFDSGKVTHAVPTQQTGNYLDLAHDRSPASALLVVIL